MAGQDGTTFCCPLSCGMCGGHGCELRTGGTQCCTTYTDTMCATHDAVACVMPQDGTPQVAPTPSPAQMADNIWTTNDAGTFTNKVQIFYEALCPDSARLLSNKENGLWNSYNSKKDTWQFELYPYGNAHKDNWGNTICQHGSQECEGNIMHQCALYMMPANEAVALVECLMLNVHLILSGKADEVWGYSQPQTYHEGGQDDSNEHVWTYSGQAAPAVVLPTGVTDYKKQVADPCFQKMHRPDWETLIMPCAQNSSGHAHTQAYFEENTISHDLTWVPSVFIDNVLSFNASHGEDLLSYLQ